MSLVLAARDIPRPLALLRRYCGPDPEFFAYRYFDCVPTSTDPEPAPTDVLASAALHPGLSNADLRFFLDHREALGSYVSLLPADMDLGEHGDRHEALFGLMEDHFPGATVTTSLLTKVLHRKRPRLVPLFDRAVIEWYRPITRARGEAAWPAFVAALRADLARDENIQALQDLSCELAQVGLPGPVPSRLRLADIAIWMSSRPPKPSGRDLSDARAIEDDRI